MTTTGSRAIDRLTRKTPHAATAAERPLTHSAQPLVMQPHRTGLRIAQLITGSEFTGGAETHLRDLVLGLRSHGHDCTLLVGPPNKSLWVQLRQNGIPVRVIKSLRKPLHPVRDSVALAEIVRELVSLRPDLLAIHTAKSGFLGRFAAAMLRIPCVFTPHGCSIIDRNNGRTSRLFLTLEYLAGHLGNTTITVCNHEERLAAESGIVNARNLRMVHNGIPDVAAIAKPDAEPVVITMVARFDPPKDHVTLLRAVSALKECRWTLRLAGSGALLGSAKELAVRLGVQRRVDFIGETSKIPGLLADSQIFVLTSKVEAFPISILEAMRAGLPVVASDVGGISEAILDGETGFLIPSGDDRALSERLALLLQSPGLRAALGNNARRRYLGHFTADAMVTRTMDIYAAAVTRRIGANFPIRSLSQ